MAGWEDLISGFSSLFGNDGGGVDPWELMGDPSAYGLFDWGNLDNLLYS